MIPALTRLRMRSELEEQLAAVAHRRRGGGTSPSELDERLRKAEDEQQAYMSAIEQRLSSETEAAIERCVERRPPSCHAVPKSESVRLDLRRSLGGVTARMHELESKCADDLAASLTVVEQLLQNPPSAGRGASYR